MMYCVQKLWSESGLACCARCWWSDARHCLSWAICWGPWPLLQQWVSRQWRTVDHQYVFCKHCLLNKTSAWNVGLKRRIRRAHPWQPLEFPLHPTKQGSFIQTDFLLRSLFTLDKSVRKHDRLGQWQRDFNQASRTFQCCSRATG